MILEKGLGPVAAIIGPTAVGKTGLSLELASYLDAEIISVDSRQVYRYLDIGTDKVSPETRKSILHHLIDVADPDERFTVMDFVSQAQSAVDRIRSRGKNPLFVGGTPFYYKVLFEGVISQNLPSDPEIRLALENEAREKGREFLHGKLENVDRTTAAKLHTNDLRRVIRALEVYDITGKPISWWYCQKNDNLGTGYDFLYLGLISPRSELYERISARVREQFASGYVEEVKWLLDHGFGKENPSMQGFGYKEIIRYLEGDITLEEAIEGDIKATKAFSRRQMTWFKHFSPSLWYDTSVLGREVIRRKMLSAICEHCEGSFSGN